MGAMPKLKLVMDQMLLDLKPQLLLIKKTMNSLLIPQLQPLLNGGQEILVSLLLTLQYLQNLLLMEMHTVLSHFWFKSEM